MVPITTIYVAPRNQFYAQYIINDGDPHAMKYDDLYYFLLKHVPKQSAKISKFVYGFRYFLVVVPENKVVELKFDLKAEREKLRQELKRNLYKFSAQHLLDQEKEKDVETKTFGDKVKNLFTRIKTQVDNTQK